MTDPDLRLFIQTVLEGFVVPHPEWEILREEEERDKHAFHQEISVCFAVLQERDADTLENRFGFVRRNGRASLPRWMGKALLPKICGFPPMQWANSWGRILCALKCTAARMGKPKPILLIARCIAVSALPLKYYLQRSPKLKIVSIVRQMRSRSDWRDITIFQVA